MSIRLNFGVLAVLCAAACGGSGSDAKNLGDAGNTTDAGNNPSGLVCPSDSKLTYDKDIKPFMTSYCTRCHATTVAPADRNGAPSDHNFDSEQGVIKEAYHIAQDATAGDGFVHTKMPPNGPKPSVDERKVLGEWLACNADPNTPDND